jgi:hypothetical protein
VHYLEQPERLGGSEKGMGWTTEKFVPFLGDASDFLFYNVLILALGTTQSPT